MIEKYMLNDYYYRRKENEIMQDKSSYKDYLRNVSRFVKLSKVCKELGISYSMLTTTSIFLPFFLHLEHFSSENVSYAIFSKSGIDSIKSHILRRFAIEIFSSLS